MKPIRMGLFALACLLGTPATAATLLNGSFENTFLWGSRSGAVTTAPAGWTNTSGAYEVMGSYWQAAHGVRSLSLGQAQMVQFIDNLVVGATYQLGFSMAGDPTGGPTVKTLEAEVLGHTLGRYDINTKGRSRFDMGWTRETLVFTAKTSQVAIRFSSLTPGGFGAALDHVTLARQWFDPRPIEQIPWDIGPKLPFPVQTASGYSSLAGLAAPAAPVPLPGSAALLLGGLGLLATRSRRT